MSRVTQPVGQVRLTNVAAVRLKKNGKRFEVAAYQNKVLNWRSGVEKDLSEVLQTTTVFTNVSKGDAASRKDLEEAFGADITQEKAAIYILNHGEIEVGEKERQALFESLFRDVATIVAEKCVNPASQRPYTLSLIEKALRDAHFAVVPTKGAKQQALKAIQALQKSGFPIERARMRVRITVPVEEAEGVRGFLLSVHADIEGGGSSAASASAPARGLDLDVGSLSIVGRDDDDGPTAAATNATNAQVRAAAPAHAASSSSSSSSSSGPCWTLAADGELAVFHAVVDPGCFRGLEERMQGLIASGAAGAALEVLSLTAASSSAGAAAAAGRGASSRAAEEDEDDAADAGKGKKKDKKKKGKKGGKGGKGGDDDDDAPTAGGAGKAKAGGGAEDDPADSSGGSDDDDGNNDDHDDDEPGKSKGGSKTAPGKATSAPATGALASSSSSSSSSAAAASASLSSAAAAAAAASTDLTTAAARGTGMLVSRVTQPGARLACASCSAAFESADAHRTHFRSDHHRFNLKRKVKGLPGLDEASFNALSDKQKREVLDAMD